MTTTRNNLRKLVRKFIYGILSLILIVLAYTFSQSTQMEQQPADNQQRFIESSAIVVSSDYEAIAHNQARTVQARWFLIPYQPQLRTWNNDEQTHQYYLQQRTKLNSPAQIKLSTLLLSTENIKSPAVSVSDEQLKQDYQQQLSHWQPSEKRRANHLLIQCQEPSCLTKAMAQIQTIKTQLHQGASFARLAKAYSDDVGTAINGGDMGFFSQQELLPEVGNALFSLTLNQISEPITSSEGIHLLQLTDISNEAPISFEQAKSDLIQQRQRQADQQYLAQTIKHVQQAIQQGQTIADIAQQWSLKTVNSDFFSVQTDDGIVHRDTFRQAVFSDSDLLQGDTKPRLFTLDAQHSLLYSYQDFLPAEPLAFDAVRTQLALELARSQAIRDSFQLAEQYRRQLNQGESLSLNPSLQIKTQTIRWISTYNDDVDADVVRLLLSNPLKSWHINKLPSGDILLSYIFSKSYDVGRLGLVRRLNENSLFQTWQSAESDALMR
jgi:peptidyl-prolyl cis-trans isomerase D